MRDEDISVLMLIPFAKLPLYEERTTDLTQTDFMFYPTQYVSDSNRFEYLQLCYK